MVVSLIQEIHIVGHLGYQLYATVETYVLLFSVFYYKSMINGYSYIF